MRKVLFGVVAVMLSSAHAGLPTPTEEVSYSVKIPQTPATTSQAVSFGVSQPPVQTALPVPPRQTSSAQTGSVVPVVNAFVVQMVDGQETLVPVNVGTKVKSGDVIEYQGLFTNHGDRIRQMNVVLNIPPQLELLGGVVPQHVHASHDGNRFVRMPIRVRVNGQIEELPLSQYRALRWTVEDVGIGGTAVVKYRAKVK